MFRCIVAPVDGSPFGEHAIPLAAAIAHDAGVPLHAVHVHEPLIMASGAEVVAFSGPWTEITKEQERSYLDGLAERVSAAHGIEVRPVLIDGAVAPALESYARGCGAGLVVMSTHAHTRFRRLWHHGIADHITRELPIPVLLVRPDEPDTEPRVAEAREIRHILITLDGSSAAEEAIRPAIALGRGAASRYTLLRVVQEGRASTAEYLEIHAGRMRAQGMEVQTRILTGKVPGAAILEFVRETQSSEVDRIDTVAMSCRARGQVARIVGHHTSDLVLEGSPVPILMIHAGAEVPERATDPPLLIRAEGA